MQAYKCNAITPNPQTVMQCRSQLRRNSSQSTIGSTARASNDDPVSLLHFTRILWSELNLSYTILIVTDPYVLTSLPWLSSTESEWCYGSSLAQHRDIEITSELYVPNTSISSMELALAARTASD